MGSREIQRERHGCTQDVKKKKKTDEKKKRGGVYRGSDAWWAGLRTLRRQRTFYTRITYPGLHRPPNTKEEEKKRKKCSIGSGGELGRLGYVWRGEAVSVGR